MNPVRRKRWFVIAGVVLLLAFATARVASDFTRGGSAERGGMALPEGGPADTTGIGADDATLVAPGGAGSADADPEAGEGESDPDVVPTALIYQLVDELREAGVGPVMSTDLTVEYADERDTIVMRGEFENTSASEVRFERRGGEWRLMETE